MRYPWAVSLVLSCALVAAGGAGVEGGTTTRAPPRTLDRQAAELAWRTWLQSPESGSQNAPPRRITTKSLFITPLVCPKGQRLDRNGCVQVVTVNKEEHERILLEQLNALFTSPPSGDVVYDYGDDDGGLTGPYQLSIPIALDPQASALQAQEPTAQAQDLQPNFVKVDKKDENKPNPDASIEAELELMKLHQAISGHNDTAASSNSDVLNHNVLSNFMPNVDKPKRDSQVVNKTDVATNFTDEGQKELVFGHVNIDPYLYKTESETTEATTETTTEEPTTTEAPPPVTDTNNDASKTNDKVNASATQVVDKSNTTTSVTHELKKDGEQSKLNPEHDYADIGEAIKLISRYAEVTTDDNFSKDHKKYAIKDDSILGTRTKLQYRRNKPRADTEQLPVSASGYENKENVPMHVPYLKSAAYYRYPWQDQHSPTPPPDYPFRHLQDYWPGWNQIGGVYNTGHENPRRHHHTYPHNYYRLRGTYANLPETYPRMQEAYAAAGPRGYLHAVPGHHGTPMRAHSNNQDLYSLLGLRHWFSSEGASKR